VLVGSGAQQGARFVGGGRSIVASEALAEMIAEKPAHTGDRPHRREHPAGAHRGRPPVDGDGGGLDRGAVKTVPPQWFARAEGAEGLDVGRGDA